MLQEFLPADAALKNKDKGNDVPGGATDEIFRASHEHVDIRNNYRRHRIFMPAQGQGSIEAHATIMRQQLN